VENDRFGDCLHHDDRWLADVFSNIQSSKNISLFPANYLYIAGLMLFAYYTMRINNRRWTARLLFEKLK